MRMAGDGEVGSRARFLTPSTIVVANQRTAQELERVLTSPGREGKTRHRRTIGLLGGAWREMEAFCQYADR